jgi:hypothetical protein
MRSLVMSACPWSRLTLSGSTFMLTGVMSWMIGQHEGAAVDHHLLAEEAGAHEGDLLRRAAVEPLHHPVDDRDATTATISQRMSCPMSCPVMLTTFSAQRPLMRLKARVCSVSAVSAGRRSIEDAP